MLHNQNKNSNINWIFSVPAKPCFMPFVNKPDFAHCLDSLFTFPFQYPAEIRLLEIKIFCYDFFETNSFIFPEPQVLFHCIFPISNSIENWFTAHVCRTPAVYGYNNISRWGNIHKQEIVVNIWDTVIDSLHKYRRNSRNLVIDWAIQAP